MWKTVYVLVITSTLLVANFVTAQDLRSCNQPDETSAGLIMELSDWMTTRDPDDIRLRDNTFKIPVVKPKEIVVVTDETVCKHAIDALAKLPHASRPMKVYVIRMGPKYFAVHDPTDKTGEMVTVRIMDRRFHFIGGWTGP